MNQARLKKLLRYDKKSGVFWWLNPRNNFVKVGDVAGNVSTVRNNKYIHIKIDYETHKAHRLAWLYVFGYFPDFEIDHEDGNGLNNRISNLRDVTHIENMKNKKRYETNSSGVSGVHYSRMRGKWLARISVDGKRMALGSFRKKEEAIKARKEAETKYSYHPNHGKR